MEIDFELVLYIIFLAIALLSRLLKKRKKDTPAPAPKNQESMESKPVSFEDLLREFTQEKAPEPEPEPEPFIEPEPEFGTEYEYQDSGPSDEEINDIYQKSIIAANQDASQEAEEERRPVFAHFAEYEEEEVENPMAGEIREMLKDKNNAAKAIILSEIINRKY